MPQNQPARIRKPPSSTSPTVNQSCGGFLILAGWFWGIYRLWRSPGWTRRDKLIGTLVPPYGLFGGLAPSFWFAATGSEALDVLLFGVPLIIPFITSGYLIRRHYAS